MSLDPTISALDEGLEKTSPRKAASGVPTNVTLKDVARIVGVDVSTASTILGRKPKAARFAASTRQAIFDAAQRLNYQPNAAAQALATRRTGCIGMTLSNQVLRGWANHYFAGQLVGVEEVCRKRGYGLHINLYDLDNLDSFVFPKHVHQRAVDGLILAGYVRSGVIDRFKEFGIPVVCLGENHEVREQAPTISVDHVAKAVDAVRHAASLGHRRIGYCSLPTKRKAEITQQVQAAVASDEALREVSLGVFIERSDLDMTIPGRELVDQVASIPSPERPTVMIFTTLEMPIAVLKEMRRRGWRCPDDLSIIADNDDDICEITDPPLTAMGQDLSRLGRIAANALIDGLESEAEEPMVPLPHVKARPLAIRQSVARLHEA